MSSKFSQEIFDKKYREKLLSTFERTIDFLDKKDISWCACGGTALGAVRHHGLIPWDDDIDIWVPRDDYNKLRSIKEELSDYGLELVTLQDSSGYYNVMAKVCDTNSTLIEFQSLQYPMGIYIDIFPLDSTDTTAEDFLEKHNEVFNWRINYQESLYHFSFKYIASLIKGFHIKTLRKELMTIPKRKHRDFYRKELIRAESVLTNGKTGHFVCAIGGSYMEKEMIPYNVVFPVSRLNFEGMTINVPANVDAYLTQIYGDYMTPPPVEKQISHHSHYYCNLRERLTLEQVKERISKGEHLVY